MKFKKHFNTRYFDISLYVILTCIVIYILSRIADHAGAIFASAGYGLGWLSAIMKPVIIGFVVAYLLFPLMIRLEKLVRKLPVLGKKEKGTRAATVGILFAVILLVFFIVGTSIVSVITKQFTTASADSFVTAVQGYASSFRQLYTKMMGELTKLNIDSTQLKEAADKLGDTVGNFILGFANSLGKSISDIAGIATTTVFSIIFAVYFLLDEKGLKNYWGGALKVLLPKSAVGGLKIFIKDIDNVFSGYIRGQLMDAIFMAVVVSISFSLARVPYALAIGMLTGVANLIPYMGPIVGYGSSMVVGFISGNLQRTLISIIILCVIQTIDGNVINPRFLSSSIDIHPMLVIIAIIFGNKIGGLMGMVLAVPVAALVKIWFERFLSVVKLERERKAARDIENAERDKTETPEEEHRERMQEVKQDIKTAIEDSMIEEENRKRE